MKKLKETPIYKKKPLTAHGILADKVVKLKQKGFFKKKG